MRLNNFLTPLIICIVFITSCHSTKEITMIENSVVDSNITEAIDIPEPAIIYKNETFNTHIKTLLCHKKEEELSLSIINLNSEEQLLISFDEDSKCINAIESTPPETATATLDFGNIASTFFNRFIISFFHK